MREIHLQQEQGAGRLTQLEAKLGSLRPWFDEFQEYVTHPSLSKEYLFPSVIPAILSDCRHERAKCDFRVTAALHANKTAAVLREQEKQTQAQLSEVRADLKV
jgi:hypothetical protein